MKTIIKLVFWNIYRFIKQIKYFVRKYLFILKWNFKVNALSIYNNYFNTTVISQKKNFKSIPIIIISYNQLTYLVKLIDFLQEKGYFNIVIIDNLSTYKPLLEYYKNIEKNVKIIFNNKNEGHRVFWKNKSINKIYGKGYYVVTDSDIVPNLNCPEDFLKTFINVLEKEKSVLKVGFSLKIDDIPERNIHKQKILNWEDRFWKKKSNDGHFFAEIDTTFALYRPMNIFEHTRFYNSLRIKEPYWAIHGGWYIDHNNLSKEQEFYMNTANNSASWRINSDKELKTNFYD